MQDQLILDEVVRLTGLVMRVSTSIRDQDGRVMILEQARYGRMVIVGLVSGLVGAILGALTVWGCLHVS